MANALLTPALWVDNNSVSPPASWNGTSYEFLASLSNYAGDFLTALNPVTGTVGFTLQVVTPDISDPTPVMEVIVNGSVVWTQSLSTAGSFVYASGVLSGVPVILHFVGGGVGPVYTGDYKITPTPDPVVSAPNESLTITENSPVTTITPAITSGGSPVTPTSLAILTPPTNGIATVSGVTLQYTPNPNYIGSDTFTYEAVYGGVTSNVATVSIAIPATYNCDCDDDFPTATLAELRQRMVVRLGYAALLVAPPGLVLLLNDFLTQAQTLLYRKYSCFRTRRWFTWNMVQGGRFYDFGGNADVCAKVLDPRKVEWVGISKGDVNWRELICGINPVNYRSMQQAIPQFYDIRQCIEVWPAPNSNEWQLRIKGDFGLLPFVADTDVTTIDAEAVFLLALANAKAHYEQPDAGTTMAMATGLIADYTAGSHFTRRYVPGVETMPNAVPPLMVP